MTPRVLFAAVALVHLLFVAPPPSFAQPAVDQLTPDLVDVLGLCESGNDPTAFGLGTFYGEHQWLPATWAAAAAGAGYGQWATVRPDRVPRDVQQAVTVWWWANSDPRTQWPNCWDDVYRADGWTGVPCIGYNPIRCTSGEYGAEGNPPRIRFMG